jgi:5'-AMP-activated protein kinase catalytic alpha subunit
MVSTETSNTIDVFPLHKILGDGQFGTGWLATDPKSGNKVCVKVFKNTGEQADKSFTIELEAGSRNLDHPNVLRMLGAGRNNFTNNSKAQGERFFIVTELCEKGELFDFVQDAGGLKESYAR